MATKKKVVDETIEEAVKKPAKKEKAKKVEVPEQKMTAPTIHDYDTMIAPIVSEKTMVQMNTHNQVTIKVPAHANKVEIKKAFEAVFKVHAEEVRVINVKAKVKSRRSKYKGSVSGYKKAIIRVREGEALDLFRE